MELEHHYPIDMPYGRNQCYHCKGLVGRGYSVTWQLEDIKHVLVLCDQCGHKLIPLENGMKIEL